MAQDSSATAAIPSSRGALHLRVPLRDIACASPSGSLRGWRVSQQLGVLRCCVPSRSALAGGQVAGVMGRAVPSAEDGRKHLSPMR